MRRIFTLPSRIPHLSGGNELGFELFSQKPPVFITKTGGLSLHLLFRGNRGKTSQIVIFGAIGDGFQVFGISPVGDADLNDLAEGNTIGNYKGC